jgi:hypothetical protein
MIATVTPDLTPLIHALMWKAGPIIILCGIGALFLRESLGWLERRLTRAVRDRRARAATAKGVTTQTSSQGSVDPPSCPTCNSAMVIRTARRGANQGSKFWGCPRYPDCRGTRACGA